MGRLRVIPSAKSAGWETAPYPEITRGLVTPLGNCGERHSGGYRDSTPRHRCVSENGSLWRARVQTRCVSDGPGYASSPLAAVIPTHVLAHLLGANAREFAKQVRRGVVHGAVRSFDSTGYVIGWRTALRYLEENLNGPEFEVAAKRLLAIRAGHMRAVEGQFLPVEAPRTSPTDELTDDELLAAVRLGATSCAAGTGGEFDCWLASEGAGWHHRDAMVRLGASSWEALLFLADVAVEDQASGETPDIGDPVSALREAAAMHGAGAGRELSAGKFDRWAAANGSPLRSDEIRRIYRTWNQAKVAAGLETNDHRSQGERK